MESKIKKKRIHNLKVEEINSIKEKIRTEPDNVEREILVAELEALLIKDKDLINNEIKIVELSDEEISFINIEEYYEQFLQETP